MTLKTQYDTPSEPITTWIGDVERVDFVRTVRIGTWQAYYDEFVGLGPQQVHAYLESRPAPDSRTPQAVAEGVPAPEWSPHLLTVFNVHVAGREEQTFVVQRAWLLGANGGTIERIAP